jgi:Zn finger protein HypA/HybF involved in hydrogenase expression
MARVVYEETETMKHFVILVALVLMIGPVAAVDRPPPPVKCWNCDQIVVPKPGPKGPVCPGCGSPIQRPKLRYW